MQRINVPNSQKALVGENGEPSRQLQALLNALAANAVPISQDAASLADVGAIVLLPDGALLPHGWQFVQTNGVADTITIAGKIYKLLTQI